MGLSSMKKPFRISKIKLERAERLIIELNDSFKTYLNNNPVTLLLNKNSTPTLFDFSCAEPEEIVGTIVGDVLNNIRASLDVMASTMARLNGDASEAVQFPFAMAATDFSAESASHNFDKAGQHALHILRSVAKIHSGIRHLAAIPALQSQAYAGLIRLVPSISNIKIKGSYVLNDPSADDISIVSYDIKFLFSKVSNLPEQNVIDYLIIVMNLARAIMGAFESHLGTDLIEIEKHPTPNPTPNGEK
jgi:hypothetical protein